MLISLPTPLIQVSWRIESVVSVIKKYRANCKASNIKMLNTQQGLKNAKFLAFDTSSLIHTYHVAPLPYCAVALRSRFQNGMVGARQGRDMVCVNQTRPHCVNQIGKTRSKPLATRWQGDGMDTSCYVWISLKTSRLKQLTNRLLPIPRIRLNSWLNATVSLVGALENPPTLKIYAFVMGMMSPPPRQPRSWLSVG